jgi:hypothetical protein
VAEPIDVEDDRITTDIHEIITLCGGDPTTYDSSLITQMIQNSLKLIRENHDTGQLKLMMRAMKEIRYAYRVFNKYKEKGTRCVSIFGSARTPEHHPDYIAAFEFSSKMADKGWMCITGAANGIMKAGLEGARREASFGLSIKLPFEIPTNDVIAGDIKLIAFRYFFTRKLMFMSHADALVAFPGGYGTLDEIFEALTLQQTGKANIVPIVLVEGAEGHYWEHWLHYIEKQLLNNGWISPEDQHLYYIAKTPDEGVQHIARFYKNYHSSRYVEDIIVIRLKIHLSPQQLGVLNVKYRQLLASGEIAMSDPLPQEDEFLELPRLIFHHTHRDFGLLRSLIDEINSF